MKSAPRCGQFNSKLTKTYIITSNDKGMETEAMIN